MSRYCPLKDGPALYPECQECEPKICQHSDVFYCLVVGSRTFTDYAFLKQKLDHLLQNYEKIVIVSGGAAGADRLAERYAAEKDYFFVCFPADWSKGRTAGYERNAKMHQYIAQFPHRGVVAFWDGKSKGTAHSFSLSKKYKNPMKTIMIGGKE